MSAPVKGWEPPHNPEAVDEGPCGWPDDGWFLNRDWGDDRPVERLDPDYYDIGDDH